MLNRKIHMVKKTMIVLLLVSLAGSSIAASVSACSSVEKAQATSEKGICAASMISQATQEKSTCNKYDSICCPTGYTCYGQCVNGACTGDCIA